MADVRKTAEEVELENAKRVCRRAGLWVSQLPPRAIGAFVSVSMHQIASWPPGYLQEHVRKTAAHLLVEAMLPYVEKTIVEHTPAMRQEFRFGISIIHPTNEDGEQT